MFFYTVLVFHLEAGWSPSTDAPELPLFFFLTQRFLTSCSTGRYHLVFCFCTLSMGFTHQPGLLPVIRGTVFQPGNSKFKASFKSVVGMVMVWHEVKSLAGFSLEFSKSLCLPCIFNFFFTFFTSPNTEKSNLHFREPPSQASNHFFKWISRWKYNVWVKSKSTVRWGNKVWSHLT